MKHTPGPWVVDDSLFKMGYFFKVQSSEGPIAEMGQCNDKDEELANAQLIAAAPDLLEALEKVQWLEFKDDDPGYTYFACPECAEYEEDGHTSTCKIGHALVKARGEQ